MDIRSMPSTPNSGGAAKGGSRSPSAEEKSCRGGRCDKRCQRCQRCQRCRLKWDDSVVILGDDEDDPWTGESGDKVTAIQFRMSIVFRGVFGAIHVYRYLA